MYQRNRMIGYGVTFLIGAVITVVSLATGSFAYWVGIGSGACVVSGIRLLEGLRYRRDQAFARETDVEAQDERNKFLTEKAQAGGFVASVVALALASMAAYAMGQKDAALLFSLILCAMLVIECVIYWIVKKKY